MSMLSIGFASAITARQPEYKVRQDKSFAPKLPLIPALKWQSSSKLSVEI